MLLWELASPKCVGQAGSLKTPARVERVEGAVLSPKSIGRISLTVLKK